ncbi:MAG: selenocysteine-specific translation elongation factor [Deltaproteobacteria bacterium]|nr:selenocysteine-specific translation elongation factor [Deltaproteobacteria bacterium]
MIIVGTAGHIDHGKTTLVKALTGIDTDRLKEEKQRGISIELGFAPLDLPDGRRIGLVDVPGHERFVHHMIAGATGVDLVLMVIAADEGIMPQTREHLAICSLLGVRRGLVVLTKADLVEPDWLELVREDLESALATTFLRGAPVLAFGAGWEERREAFRAEVLQTIAALADTGVRPGGDRPLLLPIDRVFTIKGFGTVVTGTVVSGSLAAGEALEVLPDRLPVKARYLEVHNRKTLRSEVGTRTAVNLADAEGVARGMVLARPDTVEPTRRLVMRLEAVPNLAEPARSRFGALFHVGTTYVEAEVRLLDRDRLGPGEVAIAALHLRQPVVLLPGMHAVLRAFSPVADFGKTLGGGRILLPVMPRMRPEALEALGCLLDPDPAARVEAATLLAGPSGVRRRALPAWVDLDPVPLGDAARTAAGRDAVVVLPPAGVARGPEDDVLLHRLHERQLLQRARDRISAFHAASPRRPAMPREELRSQLPGVEDPRFFHALCDRWVADGDLEGGEQGLRLPGFSVDLGERFLGLAGTLEERLLAAGMTPPTLGELRDAFPGRDLADALEHLVSEGRVVRVSPELLFHREVLDRIREQLVSWLTTRGTITTQEFKEVTGLTRKYLIPLAEHFDAVRLTVRTADSSRRLRRA